MLSDSVRCGRYKSSLKHGFREDREPTPMLRYASIIDNQNRSIMPNSPGPVRPFLRHSAAISDRTVSYLANTTKHLSRRIYAMLRTCRTLLTGILMALVGGASVMGADWRANSGGSQGQSNLV